MFDKILIMGDVLRCTAKNPHPADLAVKWLYYALMKQLAMATGKQVQVIQGEDKSVFDRDKFYALSGYKNVNVENWIKINLGQYSPESERYFVDCFKGNLLIFQEAGAFHGIVKKNGLPYIDIYIGIIRFLQDLRLAVRTNLEGVREKLTRYIFPEDRIYVEANLLKAYYLKNSRKLKIRDNSLLFCAQTTVDLSLICNGKLVTIFDYEKEIRSLFSKYDRVYYKVHPSSRNVPEYDYMKSLSNVRVIKENIYKLLSSDEIRGVAALSSGTLTEAKYFGVESHRISHKHVNYYFGGEGQPAADDYMLISNDFLSPDFWSDILSPVMPTRECPHYEFNPNSNYLRCNYGAWWGYEVGADSKLDRLNDEIQELKKQIPVSKDKGGERGLAKKITSALYRFRLFFIDVQDPIESTE